MISNTARMSRLWRIRAFIGVLPLFALMALLAGGFQCTAKVATARSRSGDRPIRWKRCWSHGDDYRRGARSFENFDHRPSR